MVDEGAPCGDGREPVDPRGPARRGAGGRLRQSWGSPEAGEEEHEGGAAHVGNLARGPRARDGSASGASSIVAANAALFPKVIVVMYGIELTASQLPVAL